LKARFGHTNFYLTAATLTEILLSSCPE